MDKNTQVGRPQWPQQLSRFPELCSARGRAGRCRSSTRSCSTAGSWRFYPWKGQTPRNGSIRNPAPRFAELSLSPITHAANAGVWMQICHPKGAVGTTTGLFTPPFPVIARTKLICSLDEGNNQKRKMGGETNLTLWHLWQWQEYKKARSPIFKCHHPAAVGLHLCQQELTHSSFPARPAPPQQKPASTALPWNEKLGYHLKSSHLPAPPFQGLSLGNWSLRLKKVFSFISVCLKLAMTDSAEDTRSVKDRKNSGRQNLQINSQVINRTYHPHRHTESFEEGFLRLASWSYIANEQW